MNKIISTIAISLFFVLESFAQKDSLKNKFLTNEQVIFDYFIHNILPFSDFKKVYYDGFTEAKISSISDNEVRNEIYKSDTIFFKKLDDCSKGNDTLSLAMYIGKSKYISSRKKNRKYRLRFLNACIINDSLYMSKIIITDGTKGNYFYVFYNEKYEFRYFKYFFIF